MTNKLTDAQVERECVEQVFRLTGGELGHGDHPWKPLVADAGRYGYRRDLSFRYTYDEAPEYVERGEREAWEEDGAVVTVVGQFLYSSPPDWIVDEAGAWVQVAVYTSSGETECVFGHTDEGVVPAGEECPYCGAQAGEAHGHIYLGDGWAEVVYAFVDESHEDYWLGPAGAVSDEQA